MIRKIFDNLEEYFLSLTLAVMTLTVIVQILCRYVLNYPLDWSEEIARFLFVWLIYIGSSLAIKKRRHIKIDAGLHLFPKSWRPWVELTGKLLFFVFGALLLYDSSQHLYRLIWVRPQISPALLVSMAFAYGAVPIGFALMLVRLVQDCLRFFRDREYLDPDVLKRIAAEEGGTAL